MSEAFLNELNAQRAEALTQLHTARAAGDDGEAALALARLRDLEELLNRSATSDVQLDGELLADRVINLDQDSSVEAG